MDLSKQRFGFWRAPVTRRATCDAAQEAVVPDFRGDIASIALASASVFIDDKKAQDGSLRLSGRVKGDVICSDENGAVFPVSLSIPIKCRIDDAEVPDGSEVRLRAVPCQLSAREINSRKLSFRAGVCVTAEIFSPAEAEVCGGVPEGEGLCVRRNRHELQTVVSVTEKQFPVSDRLELPQGAPLIGELLRCEGALSCLDCKTVGGKAIFRGAATIRAVYTDTGGNVEAQVFELPFSQIIETRTDDACSCCVELRLAGLELEPAGTQAFSAELAVCAVAVCRGSVGVECVEDVYSLERAMEAVYDEVALSSAETPETRRVQVRELIETGSPAKSAADVSVLLSEPEEDEGAARVGAEISLAYFDAGGALCSAKRTVNVLSDLRCASGDSLSASLTGDVYAAPAAGGIEVRFTAELNSESYLGHTLCSLSAVSPGEALNISERPALVIKSVAPGESLWELAKRCGSTVRLISEVNAGAEDGFLLIPAAGRGDAE